MQKTRKAYVIKSEFKWYDIGTFSAMCRFLSNHRGNSITGNAFMEQSENCSVFGKEKLIIGFWVKDLIIVDAGDVLIVMDKNKDQEIKHLVNVMQEQKNYDKYL